MTVHVIDFEHAGQRYLQTVHRDGLRLELVGQPEPAPPRGLGDTVAATYRWRREDAAGGHGIADLARGAIGVAKAALGRDRAPEATISERFESCLACDAHDRGVCTDCGCFVGAKIRVASSACPRSRWVAVTVESEPPTSEPKRACCGRRKP